MVQVDTLPTPIPSMGLEAYQNERNLALARSPLTRKNYDVYLQATKNKTAEVEYFPIKLDIENVSRCNFSCTMCVVSDWKNGKRSFDLSFENFKSLIDEQYGLLEIKLQGMGEPTLQRDILYHMICYARSKHIWVRTTTNASLLHLNDNYKKIIDADTNEIQISIDGSSAEIFEKIRRGSKFDRVIRNCELINNYQNQKNTIRTKMWTVVQKDNVEELEKILELGSKIGFKNLVFSLELTDWGLDAWSMKNSNSSAVNELTTERLHRLVDLGKTLGVRVAFWTVQEKYSWTSDKSKICPWPFERAFFSSDSRVAPCCYIGNPDVHQIGESGMSFANIWNSESYKAFRQNHLNGNIPKICKSCYGL